MHTNILILIAILCETCLSCLPEELDDTALAMYCKVNEDCAKKDDYACWVGVTCVSNRCTKPASPKVAPESVACNSPSCPAGHTCHCGKPISPMAGKCVQ
jgi:hypothetical protein